MCSDIAAQLATQGIGTVATDIFIANFPPTPDNCILLVQTGGKPPDVVGDMEHPNLQVKVRNTDYDTGEGMMSDVYDYLHRLTHTTINTRMYYRIDAQSSYSYMGLDEANRHVWVCNFIVDKLVE
jgi:hypothetical protein